MQPNIIATRRMHTDDRTLVHLKNKKHLQNQEVAVKVRVEITMQKWLCGSVACGTGVESETATPYRVSSKSMLLVWTCAAVSRRY